MFKNGRELKPEELIDCKQLDKISGGSGQIPQDIKNTVRHHADVALPGTSGGTWEINIGVKKDIEATGYTISVDNEENNE